MLNPTFVSDQKQVDVGSAPSLVIEYKNKDPLEVTDFANSLFAVANEFKHYSETVERGSEAEIPDFRLFVKEMKEGSIIAVLEAYAVTHPLAATVAGTVTAVKGVNEIVKFGDHLKTAYNSLLNPAPKKPELTKSSLDNVDAIFRPTSKDDGSHIVINVTGNDNKIQILNATSNESSTVRKAAKKELKNLAIPAQESKERVTLTWYQVRKGNSDKWDRAVISSISDSPFKCVFQNETVKAAILADAENLFKFAYVVDVMVERVRGKISCYKIMGLYNKIALPDPPAPPPRRIRGA